LKCSCCICILPYKSAETGHTVCQYCCLFGYEHNWTELNLLKLCFRGLQTKPGSNTAELICAWCHYICRGLALSNQCLSSSQANYIFQIADCSGLVNIYTTSSPRPASSTSLPSSCLGVRCLPDFYHPSSTLATGLILSFLSFVRNDPIVRLCQNCADCFLRQMYKPLYHPLTGQILETLMQNTRESGGITCWVLCPGCTSSLTRVYLRVSAGWLQDQGLPADQEKTREGFERQPHHLDQQQGWLRDGAVLGIRQGWTRLSWEWTRISNDSWHLAEGWSWPTSVRKRSPFGPSVDDQAVSLSDDGTTIIIDFWSECRWSGG
jgi:hypothetical protein